MTALLERALAAHGGRERWASVERVHARVRAGGLAFSVKGQRRPIDLRATAEVAAPRVTLRGWPRPDTAATFAGGLLAVDGGAPRPVPRPRRLRWHEHDLLAFSAMALWNYLTQPFLLARPGVTVREAGPATLEARFPPGLPTHCARQRFQVDERGLIVRHDYTAGAMGPFARAAHHCDGHRAVEGIVVATRRRVVPRAPGGRALPGPALVWIELGEIGYDRRAADHGPRG